MKEYEHVEHSFGPVYDSNSKVLILGSFPSVKSREGGFYYHHKQNRFWRLISEIFGEKIPLNIDEKKQIILKNKLALWDVISSCDIIGSNDASIKNVVPSDIKGIIENSSINYVVLNGKTAGRLFEKYNIKNNVLGTNIPYIILPSTSPANAAYSFEMLLKEWRKIL